MNVKHLFMVAAALTLTSVASQAKAPVQVGLRAGVNRTTISETRITPGMVLSHENDWNSGFTIGAMVDVPLTHNFYLSPGFFYDYRHNDYRLMYSYVVNNANVAVNNLGSITTNWFQIPMLMSYRVPVKAVEFQFDFGPYLSLGLGGRDKVTSIVYGEDPFMEPETIKTNAFGYGDDARYFNIDWGFDFGVGLLIAGHYYVGTHYLIGARNIALNKSAIQRAHSQQWQFSVGYNF